MWIRLLLRQQGGHRISNSFRVAFCLSLQESFSGAAIGIEWKRASSRDRYAFQGPEERERELGRVGLGLALRFGFRLIFGSRGL